MTTYLSEATVIAVSALHSKIFAFPIKAPAADYEVYVADEDT
jgi:hypothetical protein